MGVQLSGESCRRRSLPGRQQRRERRARLLPGGEQTEGDPVQEVAQAKESAAILEEEVPLVNEIFQQYFDEHVYELMPTALKEEIETLLSPFTTENGVDERPYRKVA